MHRNRTYNTNKTFYDFSLYLGVVNLRREGSLHILYCETQNANCGILKSDVMEKKSDTEFVLRLTI